MANSLNKELSGKTVVIKGDGPESGRTLLVDADGGFGAFTYTAGTTLFGTHTATGRHIRVSGLDVEKILE